MTLRRFRTLNVVMALVAPSLVATALIAGGPDMLLAVPLLACLIPLLFSRYAGEAKIHRLAGWVRARRVRRRPMARRAQGSPRRRRSLVPRGGRLIAASLAVRPPPYAANAPA